MRPEFITNEDIIRWSEKIDNDPMIQLDENYIALINNPIVREVCYAGQYLSDKLTELNCPDHIIGCIMFMAGKMCFGRKNPWEIHQNILNQYLDGTLQYETNEDDN